MLSAQEFTPKGKVIISFFRALTMRCTSYTYKVQGNWKSTYIGSQKKVQIERNNEIRFWLVSVNLSVSVYFVFLPLFT